MADQSFGRYFLEGAQKGSQHGVDVYKQMQQQEAQKKLQEYLQGAKAKQESDMLNQRASLENDQIKSNVDTAKALRQYLGKDSKVSVGNITLDPRANGGLMNLTPAQTAAEKEAGKHLATYGALGGKAALEKDLTNLEDVKSDLQSGKRDMYDRGAGAIFGNFPSILGMVAPTEKGRRDKVRSAAMGLAKANDPNPSEKQIEQIMGQVYDPSSSDQENIDRVVLFLRAQKQKSEQLEATKRRYEQTGYATMGGAQAPAPAAPQQQPVMSFEEWKKANRR